MRKRQKTIALKTSQNSLALTIPESDSCKKKNVVKFLKSNLQYSKNKIEQAAALQGITLTDDGDGASESDSDSDGDSDSSDNSAASSGLPDSDDDTASAAAGLPPFRRQR